MSPRPRRREARRLVDETVHRGSCGCDASWHDCTIARQLKDIRCRRHIEGWQRLGREQDDLLAGFDPSNADATPELTEAAAAAFTDGDGMPDVARVEIVAKALHRFDCGCNDLGPEPEDAEVDDQYYYDAARAVLRALDAT